MDLCKSVGQFCDSLFKQLVTHDNDKNVLVSPLSLHICLSTLLHGARNNSESQLKSAIKQQPDADINDVANFYNSLLTSLKEKDAPDILLLSNRALISELFGLQLEYENALKSKYQSKIVQVDFKNNGRRIVHQVNEWTSESTIGLIYKVLESPLPEETALLLLNCAYFKARWKNKFDESYSRDFHISNMLSKNVSFMKVKAHFNHLAVPFGSTDGHLHEVEIPFQGQYSMVVLLPPESTTVNDFLFENSLFDAAQQLITNGNRRYISLHMPKFSFKSNCVMNEVLQKMGVVDIFDNYAADLSGISKKESSLYVSQVKHLAAIEIGGQATKSTGIDFCEFKIAFFIWYICNNLFCSFSSLFSSRLRKLYF